jgi:hypothetical protein
VGSDFVGGENLRIQTMKYEDSEEKVDMIYSSLKFHGRLASNETNNTLDALLNEKNKLFDLYSQFIKDQKDIIKEQQDQIKSLNERLQTLEELLFKHFTNTSASNHIFR